MPISVWVGYGLMLGGVAALGYTFWRTRQLPRPATTAAPAPPERPTDRLHPHAERAEALEVIEEMQTVRFLGETEERAVQATITLSEMTETRGRWHKTGNSYRALELAGGVWIFKIPSREGGDLIWVAVSEVKRPYQLMDFFKGSDAAPGPARRFKNNKQTTSIPFELPEEFGDSTKWKLTDIGRFGITVDGKADAFLDGDMYPFVSAHSVDGKWVLLYLDARKGMARGTGGLYVGRVFEPEVDIASIL